MYFGWRRSVLVLLFVAAVYASYDKSPQKSLVASTYPDQLAFLVGANDGLFRFNERSGDKAGSRSYILLPGALKQPDVIRVVRDRNGTLSLDVRKHAALWYLIPVALSLLVLLARMFGASPAEKE